MVESPEKPDKDARTGWFRRLRDRLNRDAGWLGQDIGEFVPGGRIDEETLEDLEAHLVMADVGVDTARSVIERLERRLARRDRKDGEALRDGLRQTLVETLAPVEQPLVPRAAGPFVILMVGVNGAGKTTTIGKLARRFLDDGLSVMLAAGDTFRAAAVEQLQAWGQRNGVPVIAQRTGADPAAVIYDAYEAARARQVDVLLADTAGRLQTQRGLMDELGKIKRVLGRLQPEAPHEIMLVLDASLGQNAMSQAEKFNDALGLTGITVTKLDGSAKGGIVVAIAGRFGIPVRYIGIGEAADDLQPFAAAEYVDALLGGRAVHRPTADETS